jgi:hypothetical protein
LRLLVGRLLIVLRIRNRIRLRLRLIRRCGLVVTLGIILLVILRLGSGNQRRTRHQREKRKNRKKSVKSPHKPSLRSDSAPERSASKEAE